MSPGRSWLARGVAAVGDADRAAHAEAALGEVEAVADGAPDAVVGHPADERGVDAALQDEVLDQAADLVVGQRGDDRGAQAEAAAQAAGDVVLAAALPDVERARGADAALAGVEAQHHLAERDEVEAALLGRPQRQLASCRRLAPRRPPAARAADSSGEVALRERASGGDHPAAADRERLRSAR